ncbi:putative ribonuclease H-like domain-containing protein [Tanacetum coccineum]
MNVIVTPWTILARALKFYAPLPFGKLSLSGTTLTRRTLELADRSITHPKGVVEDVFVKVGSFHFPTDFVVVDFRSLILMYPLILEIPFQDGRALIDVYEGEAYFKGRSKDNNNSILKEDVREENFQVYSNPLFEFDDNYNFSDVNPLLNKVLEDIECKDSYDSNLDESTFLVTPLFDSKKDECLALGNDIEFLLHHDPSTLMKSIASILEGFINETPFKENDDLFDLECKTNDWKRILYDAQIDEAECFDPGGDSDEIDAFLAIKVPTYIEEGYYDSEGDILYLESFLSDDTTHNLSPEFVGESITIRPRIVREHEDYISRMWLLCGNSISRLPENFHTIIESLPTSTTLIEDSDSNREEIDIFSGPDDSIPPGIESDFDSEEDIIDNLG